MRRRGHLRLIAFFLGLAALERILAEDRRMEIADWLLLVQRIAGAGPLRLVTFVPDAAIDAAVGAWSGESTWVLATTVAITVVLAFAGIFFHRQLVRVQKLRETERYPSEIEREARQYPA